MKENQSLHPRFFLHYILAFFFLLLAAAGAQNPQQLVTNGTFEEGGSPPRGWSQDKVLTEKGTTEVDRQVFHSGKQSLKLLPNAHNNGQPLAIGQRFDADPYRGQELEVSAYMRVEKGAAAHLGIMSIIGGRPSNLQILTMADPNAGWQSQHLTYRVPGARGVQIAVTCWVNGTGGAAWFDDVTVVTAATSAGVAPAEQPTAEPLRASNTWKEDPNDPIIKLGQDVPSMFWNDPSVLKDGSTYRMWLSGGIPKDPKHIVVSVYQATSHDGISWKIDPKPCLKPNDDRLAWDSLRIETPTVIKVDGTYHLYYTGFDEKTALAGTGSVGHATSTDGVHWTKDPANPVVAAQTKDRFQWGTRGTGEPGVVYDPANKTFYLYYVSMRFSKENPDVGNIGILLSTSKDGSHFTPYTDSSGERALILTRAMPNPKSGNWFGYSTPAALITHDGKFHLFCAYLVTSPEGSSHRAIDHAVSDDGIHYKVIERDILIAGTGDWKNDQVRGPTVVEVDGHLAMWFAGEARTPRFMWGIGFAANQ